MTFPVLVTFVAWSGNLEFSSVFKLSKRGGGACDVGKMKWEATKQGIEKDFFFFFFNAHIKF